MKALFSVFLRYRFLLADLTARDFKVKYRRSVLGVLWSVLNPLFMMVVLSIVFTQLMRFDASQLGVSFLIYYLSGFLIFNFFSEATSTSMMSILSNASLIKKVYIPKYIFPLEKTLFACINMLFSLIALLIVYIWNFFTAGQLLPLNNWTTIFLIPVPIVYTLVFSLGVSLFLSAVCVFFRDIVHLYGVLLTALMYLTPIIYPVELISNPKILMLLKCNPMYYYVKYFRDVVVFGNFPSLKENLICIVCGVVSLLIGVLFLKKTQNKFVLYI